MPETSSQTDGQDTVFTYRGYRLSKGEFNTAMIHFYRGEISRSNTWRMRLDGTTNWAVITTGAALTFAFSDPNNPHVVVLINTLLVMLFLFIEARRYRYYELWSHRIRLLESDFFGAMLGPPFRPGPNWAPRLLHSLVHPEFTISLWEALGRRYRQNYVWIFMVLVLAWLAKVGVHPQPIASLDEFVGRAAVGPIPGWFMLMLGVVVNGGLLLMGLITLGLHEAQGEVDAGDGWLRHIMRDLQAMSGELVPRTVSHLQFGFGEREHMIYIITTRGHDVGQALMKEMNHGVTALQGTGMYTGEARDVLLCAIAPGDVPRLKQVVRQADPRAFVVINPAEEVLGSGFHSLAEERKRRARDRQRDTR